MSPVSYNLLVEHFDLILYLVQVMISVVCKRHKTASHKITRMVLNYLLTLYPQFMVISIMLFKIFKVWLLRQKNLKVCGVFFLFITQSVYFGLEYISFITLRVNLIAGYYHNLNMQAVMRLALKLQNYCHLPVSLQVK